MKRICVFTGSNFGIRDAYRQAAIAMGRALVDADIELVYGGGRVGLMGVIADTVLEAGGVVLGVIPRALVEREVGHHGCSELLVVETMHQRKAKMAELSDAFIAMPGGLGTLEEIFEVFTWAQLGMHGKPLGFLNVEDYYDGLISFLRHATEEGFLRVPHQQIAAVADRPETLLERFASYRAPRLEKWISSEET